MTYDKLNTAIELKDKIKDLSDKIYIASRATTKFAVSMKSDNKVIFNNGFIPDKSFEIEDEELTTKLLMLTCKHLEDQKNSLKKQLEEL